MKSILNNPYRIAGVLTNATAKDIQSRKAKIQAFARVGKSITSEYDFSFLQPVNRSEESISKAFSQIEQNTDKVKNALFWFVSINPVDATAIQHLISGNKEKAIEIWEKLTDEKEVNAKNFSAFNNIGTLYLLENSKEKIKQGITAKIKLIESENFKDFVHTVADETFSIDTNKQVELLIDELLTQFKNKFSTAETMDLFSNCNGTTQKYLSKKFTEEPINIIESQIAQTQNKRTKNKTKAFTYGKNLYQNTKSELDLIKSIIGIENLQYKMLADNVAKEILQCSIDYFNESQEQDKSTDYLEEAMKIAKLAQTIAINEATKNRIKENISTLEGMKDRELSQAIDVLKSIKDAYRKAINEVVEKLKNRFDKNDHYIKSTALNFINKKVAIELINNSITEQTLIKIAKSKQNEKIQEFYDLLKYVNDNIVGINLSEKEEILYNALPVSNDLYKYISEKKERQRIANIKYQKELENKYKAYKEQIKLADNACESKKWKIAIEKYEEALKLYPNEIYPKNKIDEIKKKQKDKKDAYSSYGCIFGVIIFIVGVYFLFGWWGIFFIVLILLSAIGRK